MLGQFYSWFRCCNRIEFISSLKTSASILNDTPLIAIYQCSQNAYDLFDKVIVMYEGYQIFRVVTACCRLLQKWDLFVKTDKPHQILTSITSPAERIIKPGYERLVPRTPKEFYRYWRRSPERQALLEEIDEYLDNCENYDQKQKYLKLIMPKGQAHLQQIILHCFVAYASTLYYEEILG